MDVDFNPLTATVVVPISNGSLEFNNDGSFTYTPPPGFSYWAQPDAWMW